MITEALLGLWQVVVGWFWSLWPDWTPPEFLTQVGTQINGVLANLDGVGAWVHWVYVLGIITVVLGVWVIGLLIKTARAVATYLPFVGGSG